MKQQFVAPVDQLVKALAPLSKVAKGRYLHAGSVKIRDAGNNHVVFEAMNRDDSMYIGVLVPVTKINEPGFEMTTYFPTFYQWLQMASTEDVKFLWDIEIATSQFKVGSSKTNIKSILPDDLVTESIEHIETTYIEGFKEIVKRVMTATADDDTRPILQGIQLVGDGEAMTFNAANGYMLAQGQIASDFVVDEIISTAPFPAVMKCETISLAIHNDSMVIAGEQLIDKDKGICARIITRTPFYDGKFPEAKELIKGARKGADVDVVTYLNEAQLSMKRTKSTSDLSDNKGVVLTFEYDVDRGKGRVLVFSAKNELAELQDAIPASFGLDLPIKLTLNHGWLNKILGNEDWQRVKISFPENCKGPVLIEDESQNPDSVLYVMMPMSG